MQANMNLETFGNVFNAILYLERIYWKRSSIISSALSVIMISMLWLLQGIPNSSSLFLKNIKLIPIFNWIIPVSEFLKSIMTSFNYGLVSLKYSLADNNLFINRLLSYIQYEIGIIVFNTIFTMVQDLWS